MTASSMAWLREGFHVPLHKPPAPSTPQGTDPCMEGRWEGLGAVWVEGVSTGGFPPSSTMLDKSLHFRGLPFLSQ